MTELSLENCPTYTNAKGVGAQAIERLVKERHKMTKLSWHPKAQAEQEAELADQGFRPGPWLVSTMPRESGMLKPASALCPLVVPMEDNPAVREIAYSNTCLRQQNTPK